MTATLNPLNQAVQRLTESIKWGPGAGFSGFDDVARTAAHHMGDVIDELRVLRSDQVAELRERNLIAAAEERAADEQRKA